MKPILLISCFAFICSHCAGVVQGKEVEYPAGDTVLKGYLAYSPEADQHSWKMMQDFLKEIYK